MITLYSGEGARFYQICGKHRKPVLKFRAERPMPFT